MITRRAFSLTLGVFLATCLTSSLTLQAQQVDFDRDIRPILSNNCFACHGPDQNTREADLRLDDKDSVFANRDNPLITPGKSAASELFRRISSTDELEMMPPADFRKHLTSEQIELIKNNC